MNNPNQEMLETTRAALDHLYAATHRANVLGCALSLWEETHSDIYGSSGLTYEIKDALIKATEHLDDLKSYLNGWQRRTEEPLKSTVQ